MARKLIENIFFNDKQKIPLMSEHYKEEKKRKKIFIKTYDGDDLDYVEDDDDDRRMNMMNMMNTMNMMKMKMIRMLMIMKKMMMMIKMMMMLKMMIKMMFKMMMMMMMKKNKIGSKLPDMARKLIENVVFLNF